MNARSDHVSSTRNRRAGLGEASLTDGRVIVPTAPGPLVDLTAATTPERDDLDQAIDELLGAPVDERPGRFDLALVSVGAALLAWSLVGNGGPAGLWLGGAATVLGLAIPIRTIARRVGVLRLAGKVRRLTRGGVPLDARHPTSRALIVAYGSLLEEAGGRTDRTAQDAIEAAHRAMLEVATLLGGSQPTGAAEIEYIQRRARAIQGVTARLSRAPSRERALSPIAEREARRRAAVIQAREELDEVSRTGSVHRLDAIAPWRDDDAR